MKTKFLYIIIFIVLKNYAQNNGLFKELNKAQLLRLEHRSDWEKRDSVDNHFISVIKKTLTKPESCNQLPSDSLSYILTNRLQKAVKGRTLVYAFMNNVVVTSKEKLKTFSIDHLGGGSYHTYSNYLQFKNSNDKCLFIPLEKTQENESSGFYRIEHINHFYFLFGFGTYGGGKQHFTLRIFKEKNGQLIESKESYPNHTSLFSECNRSQQINLTFDASTNTFSYNKYEQDSETGFYKRDYKVVKLQFKAGKLSEI